MTWVVTVKTTERLPFRVEAANTLYPGVGAGVAEDDSAARPVAEEAEGRGVSRRDRAGRSGRREELILLAWSRR